MKPTLVELGIKYASDKYWWHSYLSMYQALFEGGHYWVPSTGSQDPGAGPALQGFRHCFFCRYRNDSPVIPECINKGIQVKRLLEIGIGHKDLMQPFLPQGVAYVHGSSLKMWEEYFPEANIYACDIREDALINEGRIRSVPCDQGSGPELMAMNSFFGGHYDVVIDDGSHEHHHQQYTAAALLPHVNEGGIYVVEDVWVDKGHELADQYGGELWEGEKGRDDNLVIIRR